MRFLVDNQLPLSLARHLAAEGQDTIHVVDVHLDEAPDRQIWQWSIQESRTVISQEVDLFAIAFG